MLVVCIESITRIGLWELRSEEGWNRQTVQIVQTQTQTQTPSGGYFVLAVLQSFLSPVGDIIIAKS